MKFKKGNNKAARKTEIEERERGAKRAPSTLLARLQMHRDEVLHCAFSPDGLYFATASRDATAIVSRTGAARSSGMWLSIWPALCQSRTHLPAARPRRAPAPSSAKAQRMVGLTDRRQLLPAVAPPERPRHRPPPPQSAH